MFQTVLPMLTLLAASHAWMSFLTARTLAHEEVTAMPPECYPA